MHPIEMHNAKLGLTVKVKFVLPGAQSEGRHAAEKRCCNPEMDIGSRNHSDLERFDSTGRAPHD